MYIHGRIRFAHEKLGPLNIAHPKVVEVDEVSGSSRIPAAKAPLGC